MSCSACGSSPDGCSTSSTGRPGGIASAPPPPPYLCIGKDCRKAKGHAALGEALDAALHQAGRPRAARVPCQDICKGPVAGLERPDGDLRWFARLRKGRRRRAVASLVRDPGQPVPEVLADREVPKRRGRLKPPKPGWGRS